MLSPGLIDPAHVRAIMITGAVGSFVGLLITASLSGLGPLLDGQVQLTLRQQVAARLGRVPIGWFSRRRTGELATVVGEDVSAPGELASAFVVPLVCEVFFMAGRGLLQVMSVAAHLLAPFISACVIPLTIVIVMLAFDWRMRLPTRRRPLG
ncbi:ABC transporter transmembrane domain-containing protein [Nonomuraea sp. NPDC049750]|uniref:ABC transporter transmembrane domain-containing protein n=1 Tax=Nonomuraea sp. NPDC049750 TaxID=3154738 RepID=UPI0033C9B54F